MSTRRIAKELNLKKDYVLYYIRENCPELIRSVNNHYRKHPVKADFFHDIDTEEKAYYLGFLYADGNVSRSEKYVKLELQKKDKYIIQRFSQLVHDDDLVVDCVRNSCYLCIGCKEMARDLISHGCMPNKTFKLKWPKHLREDLYRHLIRGIIDGDGCVYYKPHIDCSPKVFLTTTLHFAKNLNRYFKRILGITGSIRYTHAHYEFTKNKVYDIKWRGRSKIEKIYHYLYDNSTIYLTRKYDIYQQLISDLAKQREQQNDYKKYLTVENPTNYFDNHNNLSLKQHAQNLLKLGFAATKIAHKLKIDFKIVKDLSKLIQIEKEDFDNTKITKIVDLYSAGVSAKSLGIKYSIDKRRVLKWMDEIGQLRPKDDSNVAYKFNKYIFDRFVHNQKFYYNLGLFFSVASSYKEDNKISFTLNEKYKDSFDQFVKFISYDPSGITMNSVKETSYSLIIYNKHFSRITQLLGLNCNNVSFLDNLKPNLIHHFIRGVYDGNGYLIKKKNYQWKFNIRCPKSLEHKIKEFCLIHGVSIKASDTNESLSFLELGSKRQIIDLLTVLYKRANIYSAHRKALFDKLIEEGADNRGK